MKPDPQEQQKRELFYDLVNRKGPFHLVGWDAFSNEWYDYDEQYEYYHQAEAAALRRISEIGDRGSLTDEVWIEGSKPEWHWRIG